MCIRDRRKKNDPDLAEVADYVYENVFLHYTFLWFGVGIVNLPILYTHTPWGCPVQKTYMRFRYR